MAASSRSSQSTSELLPFYDIELPISPSMSTFNLQNAVCSHGLFMMAPNKWDPLTKSLTRPLRISDGRASAVVRLSELPHAILIRVYGTRHLSSSDEGALTTQVSRMLRLSETEERKVAEFQKMHPESKARGFGRVFRSPTLFEDMVKCILFCNCQFMQEPQISAQLKRWSEKFMDIMSHTNSWHTGQNCGVSTRIGSDS